MARFGAFEQSAHLQHELGVQGVYIFVRDLRLLQLAHWDGLAHLHTQNRVDVVQGVE